MPFSKLLLQVRLREGNQEEEVSLWAAGTSAAAADIRLLAAHHRAAHQHRAPEKVRLRTVPVQFAHVNWQCSNISVLPSSAGSLKMLQLLRHRR